MKKIKFPIQIIYAEKNLQINLNLFCEKGTNIYKFLSSNSKLLKKYINIKKEKINIGIFGKKKDLNYIIKNGDRLEIYRNLFFDPKLRRKKNIK